jgi:hypothetical protein
VISLDTLTAHDAAALLVRLAARPGLQAGDVAAGGISRLCGYLPLAIGMLASQLRYHPAWDVASLAADLAAARDRLVLMRADRHRLGTGTLEIFTPAGVLLAAHRLAADGAGTVVRTPGHRAELERVVLSAFTTDPPCQRKANHPPGTAARAEAGRLLAGLGRT